MQSCGFTQELIDCCCRATSSVVQTFLASFVLRGAKSFARMHCDLWQSPDGKIITASLPAGVGGHFGPELCRFVLAQHHQGQVTVPLLLALLQALSPNASSCALLIAGQDSFLNEAAKLSAKRVICSGRSFATQRTRSA